MLQGKPNKNKEVPDTPLVTEIEYYPQLYTKCLNMTLENSIPFCLINMIIYPALFKNKGFKAFIE